QAARPAAQAAAMHRRNALTSDAPRIIGGMHAMLRHPANISTKNMRHANYYAIIHQPRSPATAKMQRFHEGEARTGTPDEIRARGASRHSHPPGGRDRAAR